jgi:hypothetical protein
VNNEYLIIDCDREHDLQPSTAIASTNGPIFAISRLSVSACTNQALAFRDRHAVLGGMIQIPLDPPKYVTPHCDILYTLNIGRQCVPTKWPLDQI